MSVVETLLVFAVIPLAIVLLFAVLTLLPGRAKKARYKPGQPWQYQPVWWEPHPLHGPAAGNHDDGPKAIGSSVYQEPQAIGSGHGSASHGATSHGSTSHGATAHGATSHGATAVGASAAQPAPVSAGPLGGARGTW